MNDKVNVISELPPEERMTPTLLPGERPGSPIIPALRKKLIHTHSLKAENPVLQNVESPKKPKRSITEIGQETGAKHQSHKSVTRLGVDPDQSLPVPLIEDSKDLGKPPLSHTPSYNPPSHKLIEGIEAQFQVARHKKFTVFLGLRIL